ncbi:MAG: class I SAM-dependent methyltransferase family protein [Halanaeroarchaeum sp.]
MTVPCVRVDPERGEATRQRLEAAGLLSETHDIDVDDGWLYIPIRTDESVPPDLTVVDYAAPERDTQTMPAGLLGFEPTYERLGDVVIVDEDDPDRARAVAAAIVDSDLPVATVVNKRSKVKGETRVRDWEVLAGDGTETVHREYGAEFLLDIAEVYFSPRLATERHRVVSQVTDGENAFDMFAGVGPYAIPMALGGASVVATDINEIAIEYLRENARRNGVADAVTAYARDAREMVDEYENWADRLVMNLPHSAQEFVDTAVALAGGQAVLHYYDIQHESDPYEPGERAIRAAAEPQYDVTVETRHEVRTYAPHEVNVVLDVRLTRR